MQKVFIAGIDITIPKAISLVGKGHCVLFPSRNKQGYPCFEVYNATEDIKEELNEISRDISLRKSMIYR